MFRLPEIEENRDTKNKPDRKDEGSFEPLTSCRASTAVLWKRKSDLMSWAISRTNRWKGNLRISNSVDVWNLRISRNATVPERCTRSSDMGERRRTFVSTSGLKSHQIYNTNV